MPRMSRLGKVLVGSGFAGAAFWFAPAAGAQEVPSPVVDSAGFVNGIRSDLAQWGIQTPEVDPAVTDSVDSAVKDVVPGAVGPDDAAPATLDPALSARESSQDIARSVAEEAAEATGTKIPKPFASSDTSANLNTETLDLGEQDQYASQAPEAAGEQAGAEQAGAAPAGANQADDPAAANPAAANPKADNSDAGKSAAGKAVAAPAQPDPLAQAQWFWDNAQKDPKGAVKFLAREATQPEFRPMNADPYYRWRNDGFSKFMAGKPDAEYVLNRVPDSYFDAPEAPVESGIVQAQGKSLYGPGTPVFVGDDMICTMAAAGNDAAGRKVGLTAGHCGNVGDNVVSMDSPQVGPSGTVAVRNDALDFSVVELGSNAEVTRSYNGVTIDDFGAPSQPGEKITKKGVASNETTGTTIANTNTMQLAQLCAMPGDSGAPVMKDGKLVGMVNGGLIRDFDCRTPLQGDFHSPTFVVNAEDVVNQLNAQGGVGAGFQLPEERDFTKLTPEEEADRAAAVQATLKKLQTQKA